MGKAKNLLDIVWHHGVHLSSTMGAASRLVTAGGSQQTVLESGSLLGHFWIKWIKSFGSAGHPGH